MDRAAAAIAAAEHVIDETGSTRRRRRDHRRQRRVAASVRSDSAGPCRPAGQAGSGRAPVPIRRARRQTRLRVGRAAARPSDRPAGWGARTAAGCRLDHGGPVGRLLDGGVAGLAQRGDRLRQRLRAGEYGRREQSQPEPAESAVGGQLREQRGVVAAQAAHHRAGPDHPVPSLDVADQVRQRLWHTVRRDGLELGEDGVGSPAGVERPAHAVRAEPPDAGRTRRLAVRDRRSAPRPGRATGCRKRPRSGLPGGGPCSPTARRRPVRWPARLRSSASSASPASLIAPAPITPRVLASTRAGDRDRGERLGVGAQQDTGAATAISPQRTLTSVGAPGSVGEQAQCSRTQLLGAIVQLGRCPSTLGRRAASTAGSTRPGSAWPADPAGSSASHVS